MIEVIGRVRGLRWIAVVLGMTAVLPLGCDGSDSGGTTGEEGEESPTTCYLDLECGEDLLCYVADANVTSEGVCVLCIPGSTVCEGEGLATCSADGNEYGAPVSCADDDPCTEGDVCVDGACGIPFPRDCDDQDPCTDDFCAPLTGACDHFINTQPGCCESDAECDDALGCTTDLCDVASGSCSNEGGPCTDLVVQFGTKGSEPGQLKGPRGVAVLNDGRVVVSDTDNHRMVLFSDSGEYLSVFGDADSGEGAVNFPSGIAIFPDGRIVVADTGNDRLAVFDDQGVFLAGWDGVEGEKSDLDGPADVAIDPDGTSAWVANSSKDNVIRIGPDGLTLVTHGKTGDSDGNFRSPRGIVVDPNGFLVVTDSEINRIQVLDPITGDLIIKFGEVEAPERDPEAEPVDPPADRFKFPAGIAVNSNGVLMVADPGNSRVRFLSHCTPSCAEGAQCGSNGCGGSCGTCAPEGTSSCEAGVCVGGTPGGVGCVVQAGPGCEGCGCEECVCALDAYCCETQWDDLCIGQCVVDCESVCAVGEPALTPTMATKKDLSAGMLSPTQLHLTPQGVLWVVDNVSASIQAFQITP